MIFTSSGEEEHMVVSDIAVIVWGGAAGVSIDHFK